MKLTKEEQKERAEYILNTDVETLVRDSVNTKWIGEGLYVIMNIKVAQYLEQVNRKERFKQ